MAQTRQHSPALPSVSGSQSSISSAVYSEDPQDLYGNQYLQCLAPEAEVCEPAPLVCEPGSEDAEWQAWLDLEQTPAEESTPPAEITPESYRPPPEASQEELFAHYSAIAARNGNLFPIGPDGQPMPTVLGLRGMDTTGRVHETENRRHRDEERGQEGGYDDTLVILHPDGRVETMPYSSHPFQNRSGASPDVDGRNGGDVGIIRPGEYYARAGGTHADDSSWSVRQAVTSTDDQGRVHMEGGNDHIPAWRDTDHDFRISDAERTASEGTRAGGRGVQNEQPYGDYATEVLFHQVRPNVRTDSSIACQVMNPETHDRFEDSVGRRQSFNYVLVDVNQPEQQQPSP